MKRITWILAALAVLAVGAWAWWQRGPARSDPTPRHAADRPPPTAGPAIPRRPVIERPRPIEPVAPALSVGFDQEARDPSWAVDQEHELELRLRRVIDDLSGRGARVDIDGVECRHSQCRVAVHAVTSAALGSFYGAIESSDGLYGWADAVVLGEVVTRPDGEVDTLVTAVFDRE